MHQETSPHCAQTDAVSSSFRLHTPSSMLNLSVQGLANTAERLLGKLKGIVFVDCNLVLGLELVKCVASKGVHDANT